MLSLTLIAPGFYFKGGSFFMNTAGLTTANVGFGILTLPSLDLAIPAKNALTKVLAWGASAMAFIGIHSYSVYLWHLNAADIAEAQTDFGHGTTTVIYMALALVLGIGLSYAIEAPFLKLRDRFFK